MHSLSICSVLFAGWLGLLSSGSVAQPLAPASAADVPAGGLFLDGFFPIGVWVPPPFDYLKWKNRGVNTMVGIGFDLEGSIAEANRLGLRMIRAPRPNPADDANEPLLLAWAHPDEPDGIYNQIPYSQIQAQYQAWKAIAPNRPVFINFIGRLNQYDLVTGESGDDWYRKYVLGADWVSADRYPANDGEPGNIAVLGTMMDRLRGIAGPKPVFAFIETSDIDTTNPARGPTPAELRAQVWEVIIHGARGLWYFPEQIAPTFAWDTTPPDVAAELTRQNLLITSLASVLQSQINPPGFTATVTAPLDLTRRSAPSGRYVFVLNLSAATQSGRTIALTGIGGATSATVFGESRTVPIVGGVITDTFTPYAVHIYVIGGDVIFANGFQ